MPRQRCAASRFAKPRSSRARAACCPDRGKLSACQEVPRRKRFYVLFASTKRIKSSPEGCDPLDSGDGSKLYRIVFFVIFPFFVPISVCGETHFFGCFEPVRKGYCSTDARPLLFENKLLYSKLTVVSRIQKGWLLVIFVAVGICFCSMLIKCLEVSQGF